MTGTIVLLHDGVHLICRTDGGIVVCASDNGWRFLPGGTREPGETIKETARRELVEEAGATLRSSLDWFGAFRCDQSGPRYRPHLPYPVSYLLFALADADLDREPTSPDDGEQITEAHAFAPEVAARWLEPEDRRMADLVRLAIAQDLI